jgi:hypothetical protein
LTTANHTTLPAQLDHLCQEYGQNTAAAVTKFIALYYTKGIHHSNGTIAVLEKLTKAYKGNSVHTACGFSHEQQYPYQRDNALPKHPYHAILLRPISQKTHNL